MNLGETEEELVMSRVSAVTQGCGPITNSPVVTENQSVLSHLWGSDEVHEGGGGRVAGVVVRQSLWKQTHSLGETASLGHSGC